MEIKDLPTITAIVTVLASLFAIIKNLIAARKKGIHEFNARKQKRKNEKD